MCGGRAGPANRCYPSPWGRSWGVGMGADFFRTISRRRFLEFAAASPCAASFDLSAWAQGEPGLIASPSEALNVFDFEEVAIARCSRVTGPICPAAWMAM